MAQTDTYVPLRNSLVVRCMASIFVIVVVTGAVTVHFRAEAIRKDAFRELYEASAYITQNIAQAFLLPGLQGDKVTIERQLKALNAPSNRNYCGAKITDKEGVNIHLNENFPEKLGPYQSAQDHFIVDTRLPKDERKVLGRIWLCTKTDGVHKKIRAAVMGEVQRLTIIILVVLAAVYSSLLLIIRPLLTITGAMGGVARSMKPIRDEALLRKNEIGVLARGFNSMVADLTETYHALDVARQAAIRSEKAKGDFLANMSHELRTPLNNIIGTAQLLHDRPLEDQDKELFQIIEKSSKSLLAIVNDILDLSKIEAGEVRLERIAFDAFEKIRDVSQSFLTQASRKGIVVSAETSDKHLYIMGDPLRLERILTNLTANALRYTERGSVRIRAELRGKVLRCEIIDTGIGIPKDRQDKIFERFTQADNSTSRRYGGTGLGLTITRELISLMNGKIGVESEVGKGSNFWFEIPCEVTDAADAPEKAAASPAAISNPDAISAAHVRVLVAEDHELNRAFMRRLFQKLGVSHFAFAETGKSALDQVAAGTFDIVLMDCHMPEMDGYTATEEIRKLAGPQHTVPIVAMTANAMSSDEERCVAAGMNAYISKPFEIGTFTRILSQWIRFDAAPVTPAPQATAGDEEAANMEILMASSLGDEKYLREMTNLFVETASTLVKELEGAITAPGTTAWNEHAHGLKGAAGIIGAQKLHRLATAAHLQDGDTRDRATLLAEMTAELARVNAFLQDKKLV